MMLKAPNFVLVSVLLVHEFRVLRVFSFLFEGLLGQFFFAQNLERILFILKSAKFLVFRPQFLRGPEEADGKFSGGEISGPFAPVEGQLDDP